MATWLYEISLLVLKNIYKYIFYNFASYVEKIFIYFIISLFTLKNIHIFFNTQRKISYLCTVMSHSLFKPWQWKMKPRRVTDDILRETITNK